MLLLLLDTCSGLGRTRPICSSQGPVTGSRGWPEICRPEQQRNMERSRRSPRAGAAVTGSGAGRRYCSDGLRLVNVITTQARPRIDRHCRLQVTDYERSPRKMKSEECPRGRSPGYTPRSHWPTRQTLTIIMFTRPGHCQTCSMPITAMHSAQKFPSTFHLSR
jgi:hypothetical protein